MPRRLSTSTGYLVREAIAGGAHFVVMRGWRHWLQLVPDVKSAKNVSFVRSVQNLFPKLRVDGVSPQV